MKIRVITYERKLNHPFKFAATLDIGDPFLGKIQEVKIYGNDFETRSSETIEYVECEEVIDMSPCIWDEDEEDDDW